ncbi:MAG: hypothetical protein A2W80_13770 [Candidatus Riflebacteria bacterium GWC2_50_8]|nr:MAG: hypothetical protein A2W80_13770 [Candidatus Riflebacteria bacterium GWC2_50_8]
MLQLQADTLIPVITDIYFYDLFVQEVSSSPIDKNSAGFAPSGPCFQGLRTMVDFTDQNKFTST